MSTTAYINNINVNNFVVNNVYASTDLIIQGGSLVPSSSNAVAITQWLLTTTSKPGALNYWSNVGYNQKAVPNNAGSTGGYGGWSGCVLLPDGRVVIAPQIPTSTSIGIFNPLTSVFSTIAAGGLGTGYSYAIGGVLSPDGRVIFTPFQTRAIGLFNPVTNIFTTTTGGLTGNPGHAGACLLPNGKIMFAPYASGWIGVFDPKTNVYTTGPTISGYVTNSLGGCVPLPDGRVILCPQSGTTIGIYDYITNTYSSSNPGGITSGDYFCGCLLPNGTVLFVPNNTVSPRIGLYNPVTNVFTTIPVSTGGFFGAKLLPGGITLLNPYNTAFYGLYDYITNTFKTGSATGSGGAGACQSSCLLPDGRVIFPPFVNSSNMGIITSNGSISVPYDLCYHPFFNRGG